MYLRFTTLVRDKDARAPLGIFQAAFEVWYDRADLNDLWQVAELRRELDWVNDHLDCPDRRWYRPYRRAERSGVCWFRAQATLHVQRARYMAWLLEDLGLPTCEHRAHDLYGVIWQDRHQVVALGR